MQCTKPNEKVVHRVRNVCLYLADSDIFFRILLSFTPRKMPVRRCLIAAKHTRAHTHKMSFGRKNNNIKHTNVTILIMDNKLDGFFRRSYCRSFATFRRLRQLIHEMSSILSAMIAYG